MYLENVLFHFYFLNMDILVTINSAIWIFETCPQNILIIKNLTHSSLDHNVGYMYRKFQVSVYYNKRNIDVQKIKVQNDFFVYSAMSHVFLSFFYYNIYINVYGS